MSSRLAKSLCLLVKKDNMTVMILFLCCMNKKKLGTLQKQSSGGVLEKRCSLNKASGLHLYQKGYWHRCFPVNFAKFLRTPFIIIEHLWWLASVATLASDEN